LKWGVLVRISAIAILFLVSLGIGSAANAGRMPSSGPDPSWTDIQKFEWYLGYMSNAASTCGDFSGSAELRAIAQLSPYGRKGLAGRKAEAFASAGCAKVLGRMSELLSEKDRYIRYMEATYDCSRDSDCDLEEDSVQSDHPCAVSVNEFLEGLDIEQSDIRSIDIESPPKSAGVPKHRALVRLKSCQGSVHLDLFGQCGVKKSYTRGDCEISGLASY